MSNPLEHGIGTNSYNVYPELNICLPSADGWKVVFHGMIQSESFSDEGKAQDRLMHLLRSELDKVAQDCGCGAALQRGETECESCRNVAEYERNEENFS